MDDREWEVRQRAAEAIQRVDAMNARREAAQARAETASPPQGQGWRWPTVEVPERPLPRSMHQEALHQREERRHVEVRALVDSRIATAVAQFSGEITKAVGQVAAKLRKERDDRLSAFADGLGEEMCKIIKEERTKSRAELAAVEAALTKQIKNLSKRLAKAEKAAEPPATPRAVPRAV